MAAYQYVYHMDGVSKTYPGGKKCFENIRLSFLPGVKIGVVGVNGAGKSTLMKIMAGLDKDFTGEAWSAEGAKVGYLSQEPKLDEELNVRDNVMLGVAEKKAILERYNELAMNYSDETADEMAQLQDEIDASNLWDLDSQIDVAMEALRCPPDDADVSTLSGGERRRVALCKLLLEAPDMLLLDEPTNHLDAETIAWLQNHLIEYKGTILIVTHDRYFLDDITGWILELDRGRGIPYEGNYSSWLEQKAKRLQQEAREDKAKQKTLERELEWMRQGAKARQAKSKARIQAYEDLANQSERDKITRAQIVIPNGQRLGSKVIEVENLSKAMGDKLLIENLSFSLPPGGIVGVIGPNGAGKSTLFKMLTGQEQPDTGSIELGDTVQLSYVDQSRDDLIDGETVWEAITGGAEIIKLGDAEVNSRAYCSSFNFKGGDQQKQTGPPIRKAEDFAAQKGWTIRDVLDVSAFEDCLVGCQKPLRTLQMVMQQNLMAISKNQRACMDQCPPMSDRDERFFECALECTNDASEQLALIDKRLNDEILSVEREVFAANTRL